MEVQYDETDSLMLHSTPDQEFVKVDLTAGDDDEEDIEVICQEETSITNVPKSNIFNKEIFKYFYGTEDHMYKFDPVTYLGVSVANRRNSDHIVVDCPICRLTFYNYSFMRHIIEHFEFEQSLINQLLLPRAAEADLSMFSSDISMKNSGLNYTDIRCEICSINFCNQVQLGQHLQMRHCYKDMPYQCPVCTLYRTSFHRCLLTHFNSHHGDSNHLMCLVCLELYTIDELHLFVKHVERHMTKKQHHCEKCQLMFHSFKALNYHRAVHHITEGSQVNNNLRDPVSQTRRQTTNYSGNNQPSGSGTLPKKSLNVAGIELDLTKTLVFIPKFMVRSHYPTCLECNESVLGPNLVHHFNFHNVCKHCGFSTRCPYKFKKHTRQPHIYLDAMRSRYNDNNTNKKSTSADENGEMIEGLDYTKDFSKDSVLVCACSFTSVHADLMATHVNKCKESGQMCIIKSRYDLGSNYVIESSSTARKQQLTNNKSNNPNNDNIKLKFMEFLNLVPKK